MLMNINDNYELILSSDDFKKMVDLYMGDEASLESNATAFTDIQEELANISKVIDSKRMSRDKIAHSVREISKIISKQI